MITKSYYEAQEMTVSLIILIGITGRDSIRTNAEVDWTR